MGIVTQVIAWLNYPANALGSWVLAPIAAMPGWLSATIVAAVTGVLLLLAFKYTSNQQAVKRVRDGIKAELLTLKLFRDFMPVVFRAQGRLCLAGVKLMWLSLIPLLVMLVPVTLLMTQLALWYQSRPLQVGEEAVMTLALGGNSESPWPDVQIEPTEAVEIVAGPVKVQSRREVCWNIKAAAAGYHRLAIEVDGEPTEKVLAVGDGPMRVSMERPDWSWEALLLHPAEDPYPDGTLVRSVKIEYPDRDSWTSGTDTWVIYWLLVSMVFAFCFRPLLKVHI